MGATYDVVIAGAGAMGSSIALHAARRGMRVLAVDRFSPPHDQGSSHGTTRLIREAYHEHPLYVPLVRRSYEHWRGMEAELGVSLLRNCGSLMLGVPESPLVAGTVRSAREHVVPHEVLSAEEVTRRFPGFAPLDEMVGVHEPGSCLMHPEEVVGHQIGLAQSSGAEFRFRCRLESFKCSDDGATVTLDGESVSTGQVVLAAGAWNPQLAPDVFATLSIERQLQQWWTPARSPELFAPEHMPVSMWQLADEKIFYTMPNTGRGLKLGWHHNGPLVEPDEVDRNPTPRENAELADLLRRFLPQAKGERQGSAVCFYTNTPDGHFLIDRHPREERVVLVSPCSGHGFKFASVIGEVVTDLLAGTPPAFDLTPFRYGRFTR